MHEGNAHLSFGNIVLVGASCHKSSKAWDHKVENRTNDGDWFGNAGNVSSHFPYLLVRLIDLHYFVIEVLRGSLFVILVVNLYSSDLKF